MDLSTFYALFSATCFTLVGLWWNVVQSRPAWMSDPELRRASGGVYLSFLLPALMGLFAQVGGAENPLVWRTSFVVVAVVGATSTLLLLARTGHGGAAARVARVLTVALYLVVAVIGMAPELAAVGGLKPIEAEALLLILLVVVAHALVWRFMVEDAEEWREASPGTPGT